MADRAFTLVVDAGKAMLENGGEVFRAQDTMEIMARALGIRDFEVYVLTNGIFASADGGTASLVRHLPAVSMHLGRVEAVNAISRELAAGTLDLDGAEAALQAAQTLPQYRTAVGLVAAAVGSGCFAFLFGGALPEIATAIVAGALETLLLHFGRHIHSNRIFIDILAGAICTVVALCARTLLCPTLTVSTAIIGALMVMTPGVALTMGIRDFVNADYLSGTIRLFDAVLVAGCLACGVALAYMVGHAVWGVVL